MPISRDEFEQGRIDLALPIADLLSRRPDLAFTAEEVQQMLRETSARVATLKEVTEALESLVSQRQLEGKEIEGRQWYTYPVVERRLGFLRE